MVVAAYIPISLSAGGGMATALTYAATTLDGKEAGYLFEKSIPTGALRGVTLWGR